MANELLSGPGRTLLISIIDIAAGLTFGVFFGALRHARFLILSRLIGVYVNVFRCSPLLVQIVMLYFALPELGIRLFTLETSWVALSLWGNVYYTKVFRASFGTVSPNLVLGARALGMSVNRSFSDVTSPLGLRASIPSATTTAITKCRPSSFMIAIGYGELTYLSNRLIADTC